MPILLQYNYTTHEKSHFEKATLAARALNAHSTIRRAEEFYESVEDAFRATEIPCVSRLLADVEYNLFYTGAPLPTERLVIAKERNGPTTHAAYISLNEGDLSTRNIAQVSLRPAIKIAGLFADVVLGRINPRKLMPLAVMTNDESKEFSYRGSIWHPSRFR